MLIPDMIKKRLWYVYDVRLEYDPNKTNFVFTGPKWACTIVAAWLGSPYDYGTYHMMKGE